MKHIILVALASLLAVGSIIWWLASTKPEPVSLPPETLAIPTSGSNAIAGSNEEKAATARQRVADAELAVRAAIAEREAAETEMEKAERDVEELERWIEGIEARGEDPVDFAEEGLAKLQPAFYAYQDAFDRFELAETMESSASDELAAAREELARIIASSGGDD